MCGRYSLALGAESFEEKSFISVPYGFGWTPRYNMAPLQNCPVLVGGQSDQFEFRSLTWGLKPEWLKEDGRVPPPINARCETMSSKPYFKSAFKERRAVVPASSFFEWASREKRGNRRIPYKIEFVNLKLFYFAALWENSTFCIVTTEANSALENLHHRMPVIFKSEEECRDWVMGDVSTAKERMHSVKSEELKISEVSTRVNFVQNDGPEVLESPEQLKLI